MWRGGREWASEKFLPPPSHYPRLSQGLSFTPIHASSSFLLSFGHQIQTRKLQGQRCRAGLRIRARWENVGPCLCCHTDVPHFPTPRGCPPPWCPEGTALSPWPPVSRSQPFPDSCSSGCLGLLSNANPWFLLGTADARSCAGHWSFHNGCPPLPVHPECS